MAVDGFTLVAQIVNFLILIYLLKRFLYRPVLDAMDRREAGITARMEEARRHERQADAEREQLQQERATLDGQRRQLLDEARAAADEEHQTRLAAAQRELEQTRHEWHLEIHREREQFLHALRRRIATGICALTRQVLADLADADLQEQVVAVFLRRLRELPEAQRRSLTDAGEPSGGEPPGGEPPGGEPLRIASAFELTDAQRVQLRETLARLLGQPVEPRFEQQPALVCGLVLRTARGELGWHVEQYLDELEDRLRERLDDMVAGDDAVAERTD